MGTMVQTIFSSFTDVIGGMAGGIKEAFMNIIYVDPSASEKVLSDIAQFGFYGIGISLAIGLVVGTYHVIVRRR